MVVGVGDNGVAGAIHRHTIGRLALPVAIAVAAERAEKVAQAVKDLEAVVVGIDDEDVARGIQGDTAGKAELADAAVIAERAEKAPLAVKNVDAPVTGIGDNNVAGGVHSHTKRKDQLSVVAAVAAERAEKVALAIKDLDA